MMSAADVVCKYVQDNPCCSRQAILAYTSSIKTEPLIVNDNLDILLGALVEAELIQASYIFIGDTGE
jgi:hypothetical protein